MRDQRTHDRRIEVGFGAIAGGAFQLLGEFGEWQRDHRLLASNCLIARPSEDLSQPSRLATAATVRPSE